MPSIGFVAIIFLFAVVWATDIAAYFVGRAVGGPKLAPRFSPNKTWSGCDRRPCRRGAWQRVLVVRFGGVGSILAAVLIAIALSMAAQAGDLFESALKRRFGVKDAGSLIPGPRRLDGPAGWLCRGCRACLR